MGVGGVPICMPMGRPASNPPPLLLPLLLPLPPPLLVALPVSLPPPSVALLVFDELHANANAALAVAKKTTVASRMDNALQADTIAPVERPIRLTTVAYSLPPTL